MAIERLSREDRFMLWPDRRWPQVNGALLRLDVQLDLDTLRAAIAARLDAVPRFRQLLWIPPHRLGGPLWIDAEQFDVADHVREAAVPSPGGEAEVLAAVEDLWCRRLDPSKPLWEMWLLTGLPERQVGLFIKIHHAIADGVAAIATLAGFLDLEPDAPHPAPQPWRPARAPSERELFIDNLRERARGFERGVSPLRHPARTVQGVRSNWPALRELFADRPLPATSLDAVVASGHRLAPVRTSLALLKEVAHARGATVNDVFLWLICAGLRRLLAERGELKPDMIVRISVPVSLRLAQRAHARGNLISTMTVPLPVGTAGSAERLRLIAVETARRKRLTRPSMAVFPTNRLLGPLLLKAVRRQRVNVASTNVPGPELPLYLARARILEVFPLLPLIGNEPLAVGAMSYAGQFNAMVVGDWLAFPDLEVFVEGVREELAGFGVTARPGVQDDRASSPAVAPA